MLLGYAMLLIDAKRKVFHKTSRERERDMSKGMVLLMGVLGFYNKTWNLCNEQHAMDT